MTVWKVASVARLYQNQAMGSARFPSGLSREEHLQDGQEEAICAIGIDLSYLYPREIS
jgi:hypothetical protein